MKNTITKYLVENKQIRIYILSGKQIYRDTQRLDINDYEKSLFRKALNITALSNAINPGTQRLTYTFLSKKRTSKISTESFSNNTITGIINLKESELTFKGGTLQTISALNSQYGGSHTSYSVLDYDNLYKDIEQYYCNSEQIPTYLFPLSDEHNSENIVLLIQSLPFANEKIVAKVLKQVHSAKNDFKHATTKIVSEKLSSVLTDWKYLETINVEYSCGCSKEMLLGLIFSLSPEELDTIISKNEKLNVSCSLCGKKYEFSADDISNYL